MASFAYKQIKLDSPHAFKRTETLKEKGWRVISVGVDTILLEKKIGDKLVSLKGA